MIFLFLDQTLNYAFLGKRKVQKKENVTKKMCILRAYVSHFFSTAVPKSEAGLEYSFLCLVSERRETFSRSCLIHLSILTHLSCSTHITLSILEEFQPVPSCFNICGYNLEHNCSLKYFIYIYIFQWKFERQKIPLEFGDVFRMNFHNQNECL